MRKTKIRDEYPILVEELKPTDAYGGPGTHVRNLNIVRGLLDGSTFALAARLYELSPERIRQIWILTSLRQRKRLSKQD
jgi:hypothetical protein